jgi:hypothetical protein
VICAFCELLFSLVLVACYWPTLAPSTWREMRDMPEDRLVQLLQLGLELAGILGTLHAIARLT